MDPEKPGFMGAFIVETAWDGVEAGNEIPKMGLKISSTTPISFTDVKVPIENLLGRPGDGFKIGTLSVSTRLTKGHSPGGTTYVIHGLDRPVAIVGDALFAQSMGGGMISYQDALETNRKEIFTLPDETVVCPGHGPMTSVGEEKAHNPFFPEFK